MMIEKCISAYHHRLCVCYSINAAKNQYGALYLHEVQHRFCQRQNIIDAEHHIVGAATSFCVRKRNDVFALQKMMLTASGQTMLCPCGHKPKKQEQVFRLALVFCLCCSKKNRAKNLVFFKNTDNYYIWLEALHDINESLMTR